MTLLNSGKTSSHAFLQSTSQKFTVDSSFNLPISIQGFKRDKTQKFSEQDQVSYFDQVIKDQDKTLGSHYKRHRQSVNKMSVLDTDGTNQQQNIMYSYNLMNINSFELSPLKRKPQIRSQQYTSAQKHQSLRNTSTATQNSKVKLSFSTQQAEAEYRFHNNQIGCLTPSKSKEVKKDLQLSQQTSQSTSSSSGHSSNQSVQLQIIPKDRIVFAKKGKEEFNTSNQSRATGAQNAQLRRKKKKSLSMSTSMRPNSSDQNHRLLFLENPAPFVSAQAWSVFDKQTGELLFGRCENDKRQVASLTKIMTAYVVIDLVERYKINMHETLIRILGSCTSLIGTSANLLEYDQLSIWELLHGMMLPSGNDAAQALAIHFGLFMLREQLKNLNKNLEAVEPDSLTILKLSMSNYLELDDNPDLVEKCLQTFYSQMNREVMYMNLKNTHFQSAHGMHHDQNYSTALDMGVISSNCLKYPIFCSIVKTQKYTCESRTDLGHLYHWQNTNKLLEQGYSGLKTGVTPSAGPCLAASIKKNEFNLIIVILSSKSMEQRWVEVQKLVSWAITKITKIKESDLKPKMKQKLLKKLQHI